MSGVRETRLKLKSAVANPTLRPGPKHPPFGATACI
jgi:hypothetical protein